MRQAALAVALGFALVAARNAAPNASADISDALLLGESGDREDARGIPSWTRAALDVLRQAPRLPARLARGWVEAPWSRRVEITLGALLLYAFAMSGHAAATPPSERVYAISVDLAHLIFSAAWLGGLFYISLALVPAARALPERTQALLLARGTPEFGVIAIVSAAALALTGSLNTSAHLTSLAQFATTDYGRVLFVKIELFLIMAAISAYHAFWLRPRLSRALAQGAQEQPATLRQVAGVSAQASGASEFLASAERLPLDDADTTLPRLSAIPQEHAAQNGHASRHAEALRPATDETRDLRRRMDDWLRREALLGVGVLLCVALLALFAGTLTPPAQAVPAASASAFSQQHTVSGYAITLRVDPAKFGQNTFTVTVTDAQGKPVSGASALLLISDTDMDMGQQSVQAQAVGASQPGVYRAQSELTMAGNWSVTVKVLPPGAKAYVTTTYKLVAGS